MLGKFKSSCPATLVAVSAKATGTSPSVSNSDFTNLEAPPDGVKRHPSLVAVHTVLFLPGAATALFLVKS